MTFALPPTISIPTGFAAMALLATVCAAHARDRELPGVDGNAVGETGIKPIVEWPAERPEADANGFVRIGDWDVKMSGSVTIDIGASVPRPRR